MSKEKESSSFSDLPLVKSIVKGLTEKKKRDKRKKKLAKGRKSYRGVEYTGDLSERQRARIDIMRDREKK